QLRDRMAPLTQLLRVPAVLEAVPRGGMPGDLPIALDPDMAIAANGELVLVIGIAEEAPGLRQRVLEELAVLEDDPLVHAGGGAENQEGAEEPGGARSEAACHRGRISDRGSLRRGSAARVRRRGAVDSVRDSGGRRGGGRPGCHHPKIYGAATPSG